jgi:hypothetical protein
VHARVTQTRQLPSMGLHAGKDREMKFRLPSRVVPLSHCVWIVVFAATAHSIGPGASASTACIEPSSPHLTTVRTSDAEPVAQRPVRVYLAVLLEGLFSRHQAISRTQASGCKWLCSSSKVYESSSCECCGWLFRGQHALHWRPVTLAMMYQRPFMW